MREWRPFVGAWPGAGTTTFRVWAPDHSSVDLVIETNVGAGFSRPGIYPLTAESSGYWSGSFSDLGPGTLYRYRLDGRGGQTFPDPASRFQPHGVHGPSQVVDPARFGWTDREWRTPPLESAVFYELHVGTFTPQGTFRGVIERLPYLKDLGVTAIELMPVADFAGDRNWGYDGVALFAPARCYGQPEDLQALVDAAHQHGLAVYLDVVYNHLGPDGAYANAFSTHYFSDRHESPWGKGVNLDGPHSSEVRRFFIENALHWVHEYHVDGLRLDATHAMQDDSPTHFLAELTTTVREQASRPAIFVAEDHRNLAQMLRPIQDGGWGIDAVWADDFHHEVRVHAARDHEGYYADFTGNIEDIATTLRQGWFFRGQYSRHSGEARGTDPAGLSPKQFVICIQNHDQIGNRATGDRLNHEVDEASFRALSTLLLLAPQTPLLFMGQEWAAATPFQFFTDHHEELGRNVTEGRRAEFRAFEAFRSSGQEVPDPQALTTFSRSRLRWAELEEPAHAAVLRLYTRLLRLRHSHPASQSRTRDSFDVRALDGYTVALDRRSATGRDRLFVVVRLSGDGRSEVALPELLPEMLLSTEDADVVGTPRPIVIDRERRAVIFDRPGAIVLSTRCQ